MGSISIEDMLRELDLEVVYNGKSLSIDIETSDIIVLDYSSQVFLIILRLSVSR